MRRRRSKIGAGAPSPFSKAQHSSVSHSHSGGDFAVSHSCPIAHSDNSCRPLVELLQIVEHIADPSHFIQICATAFRQILTESNMRVLRVDCDGTAHLFEDTEY